MQRFLRFLALVIALAPSTSFGQATKRNINAASSQDNCLTANVSGTLTDAICARGAGGVSLKGRTDGVAPCTGCIGEKITFTGRVVTTASASAYRGGTSELATITPGLWLVVPNSTLTTTTSLIAAEVGISTNNSHDSSGLLDGATTVNAATTSGGSWKYPLPPFLYTVTSNTLIYPKAITYGAATSVTVGGFAVRMQ